MVALVAPGAPSTLPADEPRQLSQAEALVSELLRSKGNLALATERLGLSLTDVLKLLNDADVTQQLNAAVRNQVTISAYNALDELTIVLPTMLGDLEPNDAFRSFTSLIQAIASLTAPAKNTPTVQVQQNNFNLSEDESREARGRLIHLVSRLDADSTVESNVVESTAEPADTSSKSA